MSSSVQKFWGVLERTPRIPADLWNSSGPARVTGGHQKGGQRVQVCPQGRTQVLTQTGSGVTRHLTDQDSPLRRAQHTVCAVRFGVPEIHYFRRKNVIECAAELTEGSGHSSWCPMPRNSVLGMAFRFAGACCVGDQTQGSMVFSQPMPRTASHA